MVDFDPYELIKFISEENAISDGDVSDVESVASEGYESMGQVEKIMTKMQDMYKHRIEVKYCSVCNEEMELSNINERCSLCIGLNIPEENKISMGYRTGIVRIVGKDRSRFKDDLYKSSVDSGEVNTDNDIFQQYLVCRTRYIEKFGRDIPYDVCTTASNYYSELKKTKVMRGNNKMVIMGVCFNFACLRYNIVMSKDEISSFMQLEKSGTARAISFLREMQDAGCSQIDTNFDTTMPIIITAMRDLQLEAPEYSYIKDIVLDIVKIAVKNNIGTGSILNTKIYGALCEVLKRLKIKFDMEKLGKKNTINKFLTEMKNYNSYFAECYKKHKI